MYEGSDEGPDRVPSWESKSAAEEQEYQALLKKQGEQEDQRNWENQLEGDVLGLDDGRPGLGVAIDSDGNPLITMPLAWRVVLWLAGGLLLLAAALILDHCSGPENPPSAPQTPQPPASGTAGQ